MLIGISGKIGAGKDAIGSYLQYEYGYDVIKFADKKSKSKLNINFTELIVIS